MKLVWGLAIASWACLATAEHDARVYLLPEPKVADTPSIPRSLARLIMRQRLASPNSEITTKSLPRASSLENTVSWLNIYGRHPQPLFSEDTAVQKQLVVIVDGFSQQQMTDVASQLGRKHAFTIPDPPSSQAHIELVDHDLSNLVGSDRSKCDLKQVVDLSNRNCWASHNAVLKYHVQDFTNLNEMSDQIAAVALASETGDLGAMIVMLPDSAERSGARHWHEKPEELQRRQMELPVASFEKVSETTQTRKTLLPTATSRPPFFAPSGPIPSCFQSQSKCENVTNSCSGHGTCLNKWANPDGTDANEVCFTCHCLATNRESGGVTHWAGPTCQKKDVSVEFWLFAGFTLALGGILAMSIGMLYSVGEEKLPGVIGAGVSRSK